MPLWHIYHRPDTYTAADKRNFATDITALYTRFGLPPFYAVALFHEIPADSFYVGGETVPAVRITVDHLARQLDDPDRRRIMTEKLHELIAPYTHDRGLHLEFNVTEVPRDTWMIGGSFPPPAGSEVERKWAEANRPLPY
ncbi:tautomerase family protein [Nocardia sp. AG03]|uniref:tautomerase family protein n=1 Tax=Nocardia sp. AG03 TaxID=3025312 RepID=UPI00241844BC|nr:tautomerase family protein [Nocardia sp. AG03]